MVAVVKKAKGPVRKRRLVSNGPEFSTVNIGGRWAIYENAAIPPHVPIYRALCEVCHHASSYLMLRIPPTVCCMSCREDRIAEEALRVQDECAVDLGWKTPDFMERRDKIGADDLRQLRDKRRR